MARRFCAPCARCGNPVWNTRREQRRARGAGLEIVCFACMVQEHTEREPAFSCGACRAPLGFMDGIKQMSRWHKTGEDKTAVVGDLRCEPCLIEERAGHTAPLQ